MISLGRLSDRNYGCRQRPRYLIFSQFSIGPILLPKCVCLRGSASDPTGGLPAPPAGKRWVSPLQRAPQNCGPQGPETPRSATAKEFKTLVQDRQNALHGGNTETYKRLRNKINRQRSRLRASFYQSKIDKIAKATQGSGGRQSR